MKIPAALLMLSLFLSLIFLLFINAVEFLQASEWFHVFVDCYTIGKQTNSDTTLYDEDHMRVIIRPLPLIYSLPFANISARTAYWLVWFFIRCGCKIYIFGGRNYSMKCACRPPCTHVQFPNEPTHEVDDCAAAGCESESLNKYSIYTVRVGWVFRRRSCSALVQWDPAGV